ncbi:guanylate-binding protein 3-like [Hyperolius riggenbachi]|uniref:guanylate-binding protein 3-like n=1 Tax=Hyperolius riggenbachi TaxID=752182 RepID=UPI0035A27E1D
MARKELEEMMKHGTNVKFEDICKMLAGYMEVKEDTAIVKLKPVSAPTKTGEQPSWQTSNSLGQEHSSGQIDKLKDRFQSFEKYGGNLPVALLPYSPEHNATNDRRRKPSYFSLPKNPLEDTSDLNTPVCLIENKGTFEANPKAISILSKINQPVVVVAIVGRYRTGKSYLMNKLAGGKKGFDLGCAVEAATKGIWMMCRPHPIKKDHMIVILDTEGLGDVGKGDNKNDSWLFCLAILLSSVLVYNCKNAIDQDALEKLKFTEEITQLIKVKSQNNKDEEGEFSRHFPMFIWAVRDFHLKLEIAGKPVSEDEYLERALMLKTSANTMKDKEFNKLRESLRMYFGCRKCFVFDLPSSNTNDLQRLEDIPEKDLNSKFLSQCQKFCDYIFKNAKEKRVQDTVKVTGQSKYI